MINSELDHAAREAAIEFNINAEKIGVFIKGAKWAIDQLERRVSVHPMEESAGAKDYLDTIRLKDIHKFLNEMSKLK